jgi:hypothetical protein
MSLRPLKLDFAARENGASWSGVAALLLGAAACAATIALFQQELDRAARLEAELGALGALRRADEAGTRGARKQSDAVLRANAVAHELARRWDRVFLAIESANAGDVALLAIEPDARKGLVRITAESKGKGEMLDYVGRLQAAQPLQRVMLDQHEIVQAAEKPVRFVVSAEWGATP